MWSSRCHHYATIEIVSNRNQISSVNQIYWLPLVGMFWLSRHSLECEKERRFLFFFIRKKKNAQANRFLSIIGHSISHLEPNPSNLVGPEPHMPHIQSHFTRFLSIAWGGANRASRIGLIVKSSILYQYQRSGRLVPHITFTAKYGIIIILRSCYDRLRSV